LRNGGPCLTSWCRNISRKINGDEIDAIRTEPLSFGDTIDVETICVVCVVAMVAEEEDFFVVCLATDDTSPPDILVFFVSRRSFVLCYCLHLIGDGV
jgi:hypothetical protein